MFSLHHGHHHHADQANQDAQAQQSSQSSQSSQSQEQQPQAQQQALQQQAPFLLQGQQGQQGQQQQQAQPQPPFLQQAQQPQQQQQPQAPPFLQQTQMQGTQAAPFPAPTAGAALEPQPVAPPKTGFLAGVFTTPATATATPRAGAQQSPNGGLIGGAQFLARANQAKAQFEVAKAAAQRAYDEARRLEVRTVVEHRCRDAFERSDPCFVVGCCDEASKAHAHDIVKGKLRRFVSLVRAWEDVGTEPIAFRGASVHPEDIDVRAFVEEVCRGEYAVEWASDGPHRWVGTCTPIEQA